MKTTGHPEYQEVIFLDTSCNFSFLTRSCADTKGREKNERERRQGIPADQDRGVR